MVTRSPAAAKKTAALKPAAKAAPKKAAPPRTAATDAALTPDEMADPHALGPMPTDGRVYIEFLDKWMPVRMPSDGQVALLVEAQRWMQTMQHQLSRPNLAEEDISKIRSKGITHVGRLGAIIETLFEDDNDANLIADLQARRDIDWVEVANLPAKILQAHREQTEMVEDNRAARRGGGRGRRI